MNSNDLHTMQNSANYMIDVSCPSAIPYLRNIRHIYSDLDGTLLAPGGKLLADHAGNPSIATALALANLKSAGIEVIVATGRSGYQATEHLRVLNLQTYISELGCMIQNGYGTNVQIDYCLGDWDQELSKEHNPYTLILESGVIDRLEAAFPGKLEAMYRLIDRRYITHAFRGNINMDKACALLAREQLPLQLVDNGEIHPQTHNLDDCPNVHIYHLMPKNTSKAQGVSANIAKCKQDAQQCLAIGDSPEDLRMAEAVATMVVMGNALKSASIKTELERRAKAGQVTLYTQGQSADGWAEFARALLAAQGLEHSGFKAR